MKLETDNRFGITIGRVVVTARGDWREFAWGRGISYPEKMLKSLQLIWSAS